MRILPLLFVSLFFVQSAAANEALTVTIASPAEDGLVGASVTVEVTVESTHDVSSVVAEIEDRSVQLTFDATLGRFTGALSLEGLTKGEKVLRVVVTDVFDATAETTRTIRYDEVPTLLVETPNFAVATPTLDVKVDCLDENAADCHIEVGASRSHGSPFTEVADGNAGIDAAVDLTFLHGDIAYLQIKANDELGQSSCRMLTIYVDSSAAMQKITSVPGKIWDVNDEQILYSPSPDSAQGNHCNTTFVSLSYGLVLRDRASNTETPVPVAADYEIKTAYITPTGALYVARPSLAGPDSLYDWRSGDAPLNLGLISTASLRVAGDYAIWNEFNPDTTPASYPFHRRRFSTGETETLPEAINIGNDVAPSGLVAYTTPSELGISDLYTYDDGVAAPLVVDPDTSSQFPRTDGQLVAFTKVTACCDDEQFAIALHDGTNEVNLTAFRPGDGYWDQIAYLVRDEWVAYTDLGSFNQRHVWVRSPDGVKTRLSHFSTSSYLEALGENGQVAFWTPSSATETDGSRYLASPGSAPARLNAVRSGTPTWRDGRWQYVLGNTLFDFTGIHTGTDEPGEEPVPPRFTLSNAGPNPFTSSTTIVYSLEAPGRVRLEIYDLLGRRVATLVDAEQSAGQHDVIWDARNLPGGIYFCLMQSGEQRLSRKLLLVR